MGYLGSYWARVVDRFNENYIKADGCKASKLVTLIPIAVHSLLISDPGLDVEREPPRQPPKKMDDLAA